MRSSITGTTDVLANCPHLALLMLSTNRFVCDVHPQESAVLGEGKFRDPQVRASELSIHQPDMKELNLFVSLFVNTIRQYYAAFSARFYSHLIPLAVVLVLIALDLKNCCSLAAVLADPNTELHQTHKIYLSQMVVH